jgi:hypothetical protein
MLLTELVQKLSHSRPFLTRGFHTSKANSFPVVGFRINRTFRRYKIPPWWKPKNYNVRDGYLAKIGVHCIDFDEQKKEKKRKRNVLLLSHSMKSFLLFFFPLQNLQPEFERARPFIEEQKKSAAEKLKRLEEEHEALAEKLEKEERDKELQEKQKQEEEKKKKYKEKEAKEKKAQHAKQAKQKQGKKKKK